MQASSEAFPGPNGSVTKVMQKNINGAWSVKS